MTEKVRLRLVFEDRHMLTKSRKKEGLKRSWVLLKPQHNTIADLASHLLRTFRLHRTCHNGITLSMDGFVLPPFESTCILKDRDIICVKRKGSLTTDYKVSMLTSGPNEHQYVECPNLLAIQNFQENTGRYDFESPDDNNDQCEDTFHVEKSDEDLGSKKRKASKKLEGPRKKKSKLSSTEPFAIIPKVHVKNGGVQDNGKSCNLSKQPDMSVSLDIHKQKNKISRSVPAEARFCQPQDNGKGGVDVSNPPGEVKKLPSRSARRKKAKRRWLREQAKLEKEKSQQSPMSGKGREQLAVKHNNCIVSELCQEIEEESDAEDDIVPVEIRPGHIRFEPLGKEQEVLQNRLSLETFQWNGITSKKKGQKWGKDKTSFHKCDDYKHSNQECPVIPNADEQHEYVPLNFDKLMPYTNSPKKDDVIAYRLIELSASWTPEISSFRVGKISTHDSNTNRIKLLPVSEYPFDFQKKIDGDASSVPSDASPYAEDGSLEIDYSSLVDVRIVKHGSLDSANVTAVSEALVDSTKAANNEIEEELLDVRSAEKSGKPSHEREGHNPPKENGGMNTWDEINEAFAAKKAQLSQGDGWNKESSGTRSWSHKALRCSALGPTMAFLRSQNEL